jgi:rhodanese-related sulfurtransferase
MALQNHQSLENPFEIQGNSTKLSPEEFHTKLYNERMDAILIDIRSNDNYRDFHIPTVENRINSFSEDSFMEELKKLDLQKEAHYLMYCNSGLISPIMAQLMEKEGFTNISILEGGIKAWHKAGKECTGSHEQFNRRQIANTMAQNHHEKRRKSDEINDDEIRSINPLSFYKKLYRNRTKYVLVDARSEQAYRQEHIPTVEHRIDTFTEATIKNDLYKTDGDEFTEKQYILNTQNKHLLYCQDGTESLRVAKQMKAEGFNSVQILQGGINAWIQMQLPCSGTKSATISTQGPSLLHV